MNDVLEAGSGAARQGDIWIFGYGSLVFRPAFDALERTPGFVEGFARRFWQGSTDHRGVPGRPGRVVTLLPEPGSRVYGVAYRIGESERARVLGALDVRERGGYERRSITFHPFAPHSDGPAPAARDAFMYVATPHNPNYLGPAPLEEIAACVRGSTGPSGSNLDYVLALADALRTMGADDPHVFAVEALLRG